MGDRYVVRGGVGPPLAGVIGPSEVDARADWVPVRRPRELLDVLAARLGSEVDLHKIVLGVLAPLRSALEGAPLGALVGRLPLPLGRELSAGDVALGGRVRSPTGAEDYVLEVARLILHPPPRAASYVRAVFAAARTVLTREESAAISGRLPGDLAELWRTAT